MDFNPSIFSECLEEDLARVESPCDVTHYRIHALRGSVLKKYVAGSNSTLHRAAMQNFCALNDRIKDFRLDSDFESSGVFRTWKALLHDAFHGGELQSCSLTLSGCIQAGRCGPGASLGARTTSLIEKMFSSPLTCTSLSLVTYYRHLISQRWAKAEEIRSDAYSEVIVAGSRLSSVPKDSSKNRTICIEPVLNMFYQLGAKSQIESILERRFKIQIDKQADINKALAKVASLNGAFATLDLRNASDSISVELCQKLLPRDVMAVLMQIRSPVANVEGVEVKLNMLSTMGNGFTFPLMTLLFAALIKALSIHHNLPCVNGADFGVFGDDLIIRSELVDALVSALDSSGFELNPDKSFASGPFRESCGGDYYNGHDVRGIYLKEMTHAGQIYSGFNRLHFWSLRNGVSLANTLCYLKGLVDFRPVPMDAGVSEGFIVTEAQLTSPKRDRNGAIFYRSFQLRSPKGIRIEAFAFNHHGCLISALGGFVQDNRVLCRYSDLESLVVKCKTPIWNRAVYPGVNRRDLDLSWTIILMKV